MAAAAACRASAMKPLSLLLASLVLVAAFNFALGLQQQGSLHGFSLPLPSANTEVAFAARLDTVNSPVKWRDLIRQEHLYRLEQTRLFGAVLGSVQRMNRAAVWRGGILLLATGGCCVFNLRTPQEMPGQRH